MCALIALQAVIAQAALADGTLTVNISGRGTVTGSGINCQDAGGSATDCSQSYEDTQDCDPERKPPCRTETAEAVVNASDRAGTGYTFDHWTGCSDDNGTSCTMVMSANRTVTAVFRDNQAPSVSLTQPADGSARRGTIPLSATASDNTSVGHVSFKVRGVEVASTTAPYSTTFDTTTVSDGSATISATAFDGAGNASVVSSRDIVIDNTAPTIGITGPDGATFGPGSTQTWSISANGTGSSATVLCSVTPAAAAASYGGCSGGSTSHSVSNEPDGSYVFRVKVTDAAGNTTETSRTFSIDATPPATSITSGPADGSSFTNTSVTFTFSADQAGSTFQCRVYPAALTPTAFGTCSGNGTHTASGFTPGNYAFEVVATDPFGNVDATPAKRTFTVTAPTGGNNGGNGGNNGGTGGNNGGTGGTSSGTNGGGVTTTTTTTTITTTREIVNATLSSDYAAFRKFTRYKRLVLRNVPAGAKVTVACKGKKCPAKRTSKLSKFAKKKLRVGTKLTIRVTKPGAIGKQFVIKIRAGKRPTVKVTQIV